MTAPTGRCAERASRRAARRRAVHASLVATLSGRRPESVISIERKDDGWRVGVEVVEVPRIPDSADILAVYDVGSTRTATSSLTGGLDATRGDSWTASVSDDRRGAARPRSSSASLPSHRQQSTNLADILERVLDKGIVIAGDIRVNLLDIELLTIKIRLLIASVDKAQRDRDRLVGTRPHASAPVSATWPRRTGSCASGSVSSRRAALPSGTREDENPREPVKARDRRRPTRWLTASSTSTPSVTRHSAERSATRAHRGWWGTRARDRRRAARCRRQHGRSASVRRGGPAAEPRGPVLVGGDCPRTP